METTVSSHEDWKLLHCSRPQSPFLLQHLTYFLKLCSSFIWIILRLHRINTACLPAVSTCDRRAIKSSSGRCVVDKVYGVALNPESFTCYDTKVERNTVLAHVSGLRVSRGLPSLPERLPAWLCGLTVNTQSDPTPASAQTHFTSAHSQQHLCSRRHNKRKAIEKVLQHDQLLPFNADVSRKSPRFSVLEAWSGADMSGETKAWAQRLKEETQRESRYWTLTAITSSNTLKSG